MKRAAKTTKWQILLASVLSFSAMADDSILVVSYDVIRDYYKQYNPLYIQAYQQQHQARLNIAQSFGGASKQAIAVRNGLPADVVTLNQQNDVDLLAESGLVAPDWQQRYPNQAIPFSSVTVFLVRKGNPKQIHDWNDLARQGVSVIFANPKTSGNGRYAYLSALGYAKQHYHSETQVHDFMRKLLKNIPIFDAGARAASITFTQRQIGDVLVTPENEAGLAAHALGADQFEMVYPSYSANVDVFVAEVTKNTARHHNSQTAQDFIASLWQAHAQRVAAENYFRPSNPTILNEYQVRFPPMQTFNVNQVFGDWAMINQQHFADGALFDQLYLSQ
ncbi:sulfate ABC transporter substrate-binding protein [Testudinibacter sp. TR-2022]|uniref:sulfate ABC transporter substrate-binding protein n=1 Tax=Testudinibacter sp. TR-2022 TaxID=2585029 RepID=UPI001119D502|nr:sulfate ABC transporter substrate-binding protein [Testudinibacter sp. TR-2022]TNH05009.1 sulfate ABC transporter substrate-binding protein [Pasteurellaceae bacterium Phil11]TNH21327.1 sulfate ABC transporter substrate-binding protein [Testudinibacter sp. TR-2022]TNH26483.1 sulfate ABC transporter substrate-binding protein [Testudinibacter sp. TR-2022]